MKNFIPVVIECIILATIYGLAALLSQPLRRWIRVEEPPFPGWAAAAKDLAARLARPVAVLILTWPAIWLLTLFPGMARWLKTNPLHLTAWLSLWVVMALINLVEGAARQFYALREKPFPVADLLGSIIRVLLITAAIFSILRLELGVDISPLLASTALLTAVVGFALQGVLSNLLAGMSLHITRSVMPSDWVSIGDVKGKVLATNWRETRVRDIQGHLTIVPNSTVASSVIHNLRRQTPMRRHSFHVGASYADAPAEVIAALLAAAHSVPRVLPEPAPEAFITEFKDFGINYVLRYWTEPSQELCIIDGDVARMIWYQFKRCGIEIPFPMSDKLLNDFMQVVYRQRSMPDEDEAVLRRVEDLQRSDFCTRLLVDGDGRALLGDKDLQSVARSVRRLLYTRGETLFSQGETGDTCFVVVLGSVTGRVEYEDTAEAHEFEFGPGSLVGEMSLMTGMPRTATVVAKEEAELLEIPYQAFACLLAAHPEIPAILSRLVAERAAKNTAAYEKLKALHSVDLAETLREENILKRFLRILAGGTRQKAPVHR
jgi:small-conductance mechanosensitive channel/CRP-like cAMP-binding protein